VADTGEILLKLIGRETVSGAARRAADGLDDLGDAADDAARDTSRLDRQIDDTTRTIDQLRRSIAQTGDLKLFRDLGRAERDLKKLSGLRQLFADAGEQVAPGFAASFVGRIGPLLARAPVSAPLLGAFAAVSPAIGATISGAVLAGLSGGVVAVGVAAAFRDPRVQAEGQRFAASLNATLRNATRSFVPATIGAMRTIRAEIGRLEPALKRVFDRGAQYVAPLTRGVTSLVAGALPGIEAALAKAGPVVIQLERGLGLVGRAAGDAMRIIGEGSAGAAVAVKDLFFVAATGLRSLAVGVSFLTKAYGILRAAGSPDKVKAFAELKYMELQGANLDKQLQELVGSLTGVGAASTAAAAQVTTLAARTRAYTDANQAAIDSTIAFEEAIDEAGRAARGSANGINTNTAAGRANLRALNQLAAAALAHRDKVIAQTNSQQSANAVMQRAYNQFIKAAGGMNVSKAAADRLARAVGLIPPSRQIRITTPGMSTAQVRARALADAISSIDTYKEIRIVQRLSTVGVRVAGITGAGGFSERAAGGSVLPGRSYVVGERGPELLQMGRGGGNVVPNHRLGSAGGPSEDAIARAMARALSGMSVNLDGRPVGQVQGRTANLYARGG
jgi:hypothetical protein